MRGRVGGHLLEPGQTETSKREEREEQRAADAPYNMIQTRVLATTVADSYKTGKTRLYYIDRNFIMDSLFICYFTEKVVVVHFNLWQIFSSAFGI